MTSDVGGGKQFRGYRRKEGQIMDQKIYKNEDRKCECWKCELSPTCPYKDKYQRHPRTVSGALGLCKKLPK